VSERTPSSRSARQGTSWRLLRAEIRFVTITAVIVALLGILAGGHIYGRYLANRELAGRENAIEHLQTESQDLKRRNDDFSAQVTDLQTKLDKAEAALKAIMPSENTYNINPNQTLIVADGRITVGLIGSPGNDNVTLDVNGKQQSVAAGQVVAVPPNCQVVVQSFDMFGAVLTAACAGAKAQ
jgi:cell division protein FtsB